jgi:hypothetical protein
MYSKNEGKQFDLMGDAAEFAMDHGTSKKNKKRSGRPLLLFLLRDPPCCAGAGWTGAMHIDLGILDLSLSPHFRESYFICA